MRTRGQGGCVDPERLARAGLSRALRPTAVGVHDAVARHGAVTVWEGVRSTFPDVDPVRELDRIAALGGRLLIPGDSEWPAGLADCDRAADALAPGRCPEPFALWVLGTPRLADVCRRSVALVGSRTATGYGLHIAGEIASGLAERGLTVISGAAYGIDGTAHRAALAVGGCTIAVVAGGVDVGYPSGHAALLRRIAAEGLVVSEVAPGGVPGRERFLSRNRIIAALGLGTVLVEAGLRSGARNTFAHARALGRARLVVPGPATSAMSAGCHLELRSDPAARLVTTAEEVLEEIAPVGEVLTDPLAASGQWGTVRDGLSPAARQVLDAVPVSRGLSAGRLAAECGLTAAAVLPVLAELVAADLVEQRSGCFRLAAPGRWTGPA